MGDAAVSALVRDVIGRLTSELIKEFGLLRRFKGDILALKEDFEQIQAVLEDAEEKQVKEKAVELWLRRLRSASLKVEDVLDEVKTEALLRSLHKELGIKYKVTVLFSKFKFRVRAAHKVKAIRTKLDDISSKRLKFNLTASDTSHVDVGVKGEMPNRETSSLILDSSKILGRDEEVEMVIRTICNKDIGKYENGEIRVYGIWGMGGLGKTTLAQLVYNQTSVAQYFDLQCWVYVSENFQVKEIIKAIITSIDKSECTVTHLDVLQETLQSKLREKKFLIVLDDVWAEENEKEEWERLSGTLSCGAEGSVVVMTTRSERTCQMMAKVGELRHQLGCLSEANSWLLFKLHAFAQGRVGDDERKLEPIGREIVVKCKGLPLAVKTLGSLMWSKSSSNDWQRVKDSNIWNLQENNVLPALKLSYDNLAPHIKRCFSYFCLFPKGHKLKKDELILLWVANGFIPPKGETDLYVIGEEIFSCLIWKSLFQVENGFRDGIDTCKMHDLVHDMARHVMRHDCLVIEPACNKDGIPNEVLHLSSSCPDEKLILSSEDLGKLTSLRSIFMFGEGDEDCITQLFNHVYVRVLHLALTKLRTLPESICKLKHLRYLNLSSSDIEVLPDSILYLQNLQVLILCYCRRLHYLPESICKLRYLKYLTLLGLGIEFLPIGLKDMISLQCLDINDCYSLRHLPFGIEKLTSLRMLSWFPVGKERGAKISELGDLNLLEGKLEIYGLQNVGGLSEAKSANLICKTNLSSLVLVWSNSGTIITEESTPEMFEEVLEGLEPNPSLEILKMRSYMGKTISPSWMDNLRNLVEIHFYRCRECEHIPPLGRLPSLRVIQLVSMDSLKYFHDDDINMSVDNNDMFNCLQRLKISCCWELISLPDNLPKLEDLELEDCQKLISLPNNLPSIRKMKFEYCNGLLSLPDEIQSFKDLNKLEIRFCKHLYKRCEREKGEDWHKISHIPDLSIQAPFSWDDEEESDE
ncbi:putative virus X resistance protein-like, coiled-coil [Helianthus annuus]|uniref:disease resistance protein RGA2-like n=1 Tax=Helianthus annuus TaxID=4232 RepID=UPI000B906668|nr:disease resistance protein RGA2-like [Helianthus annuus]KAJ0624765.1 putative virus X resistance protein-like, coiled-coil [Helianthus annuus]KAJ0628454.1 putative virus X resistance protein-like, coiled-coil [Helianthus annuus]KAJ0784733.1 putative virus X resistance protein-like, coiled-coil [Helianthus annuus]KAJ0949830.1 putative virus X resistance protein-like, coiled-coil [Helianthus annuus]